MEKEISDSEIDYIMYMWIHNDVYLSEKYTNDKNIVS